MTVSELGTVLAGVRRINGMERACIVDPLTGAIMGSVPDPDDATLPVLAGGAADIAGALELVAGRLAVKGGVEDVIVTLSDHYYLIRPLEEGSGQPLLLLVTLERSKANLALARHEIRDCASKLG